MVGPMDSLWRREDTDNLSMATGLGTETVRGRCERVPSTVEERFISAFKVETGPVGTKLREDLEAAKEEIRRLGALEVGVWEQSSCTVK